MYLYHVKISKLRNDQQIKRCNIARKRLQCNAYNIFLAAVKQPKFYCAHSFHFTVCICTELIVRKALENTANVKIKIADFL